MNDDNTVWQPVEPTTPVQRCPYERTVRVPNPYEDAIPIPPPPPKRRGLLWWVLTIALMIMLVPASAGLVYWAYTYHVDAWVQSLVTGKTVWVSPVAATTAPTQQATTALTTNYTAGDIVRHMQAVDNTVFIGTTGETIWTFSHNNY